MYLRAAFNVQHRLIFSKMKKLSRRTILVRAIALHDESFCWAAVSTENKLLMQISKSTRLVLDLHSKISSECDVTLELYRTFLLYSITTLCAIFCGLGKHQAPVVLKPWFLEITFILPKCVCVYP